MSIEFKTLGEVPRHFGALGNAGIDHQYQIGEVMVDDIINNAFACSG